MINLLPQEEFAASTLGRVLKWLLSTFRIIVIVTEMIVMVAFLSRFWLDARITDLDEEILQYHSIISSYSEFEASWRSIQNRLSIYSQITEPGNRVSPVLASSSSLLPPDVSLTSFSSGLGELTLKGTALSEQSISQLVVNLESSGLAKNIAITQVESQGTSPIINFTVKGGSE